MEWAWLGRVAYAKAARLQEDLRDRVAVGKASETLLLLEHEPVITLGRNASMANLLASPQRLREDAVAVVRASRGGDVTFHGPGQLVGYPVFRLRRGVRAHVREMASAIVSVLDNLGIASEWRESTPGVWVGPDKICAIGVHVRHRIAIHGFAGFDHIVPCGLRGLGVTSVQAILGSAPELSSLADKVAESLGRSFAVLPVKISASSSQLQIANKNL